MSFKDYLADIHQEAAERVANRFLALDELIGEPYDSEPKALEVELEEYEFGVIDEATGQYAVPPLRGNPEGWHQWMRQKVDEWSGIAASVGLDPSLLKPWSAALSLAVEHSARMEAELAKQFVPDEAVMYG